MQIVTLKYYLVESGKYGIFLNNRIILCCYSGFASYGFANTGISYDKFRNFYYEMPVFLTGNRHDKEYLISMKNA